MAQMLRRQATEGSTFGIPFTFIDDAGQAVAPNSAKWSLFTRNGEVVREDVQIEVPVATELIVLKGDDLALPDRSDSVRFVRVEWTYNSTLGVALPGVDELQFTIRPVVGTP